MIRGQEAPAEANTATPPGPACPTCRTDLRESCDMWGPYWLCEGCGFAVEDLKAIVPTPRAAYRRGSSESLRPTSQVRTRTAVVVRDDVRLSCQLAVPPGNAAFPCVIFVHGLGSSKSSPRNVTIAHALLDVGIAVLLFDLNGHGDSSPDPRGGEESFIADLEAVVCWASSQPEVDSGSIGVAGSSLGAVVALRAARRFRIHPAAMVLRAPPVEPHDFFRLRVPSLVLVGSNDPLTPAVRYTASESEEAVVSVVPGAGHLFEEPGALDEATKRTVGWFASHLKDAARRAQYNETGVVD